MSPNRKVVLGTVQFGVNYGINNQSGQVPFDEVCRILEIASKAGIQTIDTSSAYGESESVLGAALRQSGRQFNIVSKYPRSDIGVMDTLETSLERLGVKCLYGYLVHDFDFFQERPQIYRDIWQLKKAGLIQRIGFSIYTVEQMQWLLDRGVQFDILQFPYNIFDKQFEPYMPQLAAQSVEIHVRSAFLQGLFFKDTATLPEKLKPLKKDLDNLHIYCIQRGITVEQLALGYVIANPYVKGALIGVDNSEQLKANLKAASCELLSEDVAYVQNVDISEKELLSPINWKV